MVLVLYNIFDSIDAVHKWLPRYVQFHLRFLRINILTTPKEKLHSWYPAWPKLGAKYFSKHAIAV